MRSSSPVNTLPSGRRHSLLIGRLVLVAVLLSSFGCSTTLRREPYAFQTTQLSARSGGGPKAVDAATACTPSIERRLVYGLFVLPFNGIEPTEWDRVRGRAIRYREEVRISDILWSFIGIWVSVTTRTAVVEDCGPAAAAVPADRLAALEKAESRAARLEQENRELRERAGTTPGGRARERAAGGDSKGSSGEHGKAEQAAPRVPTLTMTTGSGNIPARAEQFRYVMNFKVNSATLTDESRSKLEEIVRHLSDHKTSRVLLVGHVEFPGGDSQKLHMAHRRAQAVAGYLTAKGIVGDRLLTASMRGSGWPLPANRTE